MSQPLPETPKQQVPVWVATLAGCGLMSLLLAVGVFIYLGRGYLNTRDALPEAKLFLKNALPKIAQPWDMVEARKHSLREAFEGQELEWEIVFESYSRNLGNLKSIDYDSPAKSGVRSWDSEVFVELQYDAEFEKARGRVICILRDTADGWKFQQFFVESKAFMTR